MFFDFQAYISVSEKPVQNTFIREDKFCVIRSSKTYPMVKVSGKSDRLASKLSVERFQGESKSVMMLELWVILAEVAAMRTNACTRRPLDPCQPPHLHISGSALGGGMS